MIFILTLLIEIWNVFGLHSPDLLKQMIIVVEHKVITIQTITSTKP